MNCPFDGFKEWLSKREDPITFPVEEEDFHQLWMEFTLTTNLISLNEGKLHFQDGQVKVIGMKVLFEGYRNLNITE